MNEPTDQAGEWDGSSPLPQPRTPEETAEIERLKAAIRRHEAATPAAPGSRAAVLLEAADAGEEVANRIHASGDDSRAAGAYDVVDELRRLADEERQDRCTCGGQGIHHLHADDHRPAAEERQAPPQAAPAVPDLRGQFAAAILAVPIDYAHLVDDPGSGPVSDDEAAAMADAVLAVRDAEVERLRRQVEQLAAGRETWKRKALEMEADRDAEHDRAERTETALARLAPMFTGLNDLIVTSSRDWGEYRVDAWIYAVLVGWDCEDDHEHGDDCDGAMAEMTARHGWSDEAVAKARRYRAAVRAALDGTGNGETP